MKTYPFNMELALEGRVAKQRKPKPPRFREAQSALVGPPLTEDELTAKQLLPRYQSGGGFNLGVVFDFVSK